jgi:hypothetical protein
MAGLEQAANSTWLQMWGLYKDHPAFGKAAFRPDKVSECAGVGAKQLHAKYVPRCQASFAVPDAARPVTDLVGALWPPELPDTHVRYNKANL